MKYTLSAVCLLALIPFSHAGSVKNGREPRGGAYTIRFTQDLRFGADEGSDEYIWGYANVSADDRGHMFVADQQEGRVLEFDPAGRFIRILAQRGQGPGEFQNLFSFDVLKGGTAIGFDKADALNPSLRYFGRDLIYRESKTPQGHGYIIESISMSPRGNFMGVFLVSPDRTNNIMRHITGLIDTDFKMLKELSNGTRPLPDRSRFSDPGYWVERIGGNLKLALAQMGVYGFDENGTVFTALSNEYRITKWSPGLTSESLVIERDYKPILQSEDNLMAIADNLAEEFLADPMLATVVTPTVMKRAIAQADLPAVKSPVFAILVTGKGTLLVVHDVVLNRGINTADIFSPAGDYLGQVTMDNHALVHLAHGVYKPRMSFRNNYAYTMETDEEGDNRVVRYNYELVRR